jgi:hypothetical protein
MSGVINRITVIGTAYPPDEYPNPVLVSRGVLLLLKEIDDSEEVDMASANSIVQYCTDNPSEAATELTNLIFKKPEDYLRGVSGDGFEVKRYRVFLHFPASAQRPETRVVLREEEVAPAAIRYADELKATYIARKYVVKATENGKGSGIWRDVRDPVTGEMMQRLYCELWVRVIKARESTPIKEQRYPTPEQEALEQAAAQAKPV